MNNHQPSNIDYQPSTINHQSKIYIAGHDGMVGSAILRNLQSKGYTNFVFTPYPEYDLTNQQTVNDFFKKEKPEYVVLAAAKVGGIVANNTYRGQFIYENLQIQNNIIHNSYVYGVKKLLFLGSSCIYPKNCPQPIKEEYLLTSELEYTNEPYAIAKIAGLKMCEAYNIQYGTNFIAVMPTNLYGPNDNYDLEKSHVLPALIRKMHLGKCLENNDWEGIQKDLNKRPIEGVEGNSKEADIIAILEKYGISMNDDRRETIDEKPSTVNHPSSTISNQSSSFEHPSSNINPPSSNVSVTLWGTGSPRREFLHADDLADACVYIMEKRNFSDTYKKDSEQIINTHINIGSGKDLTIKKLAEIVKEIISFNGEIIWDSTKPDGTIQKLLDVDKINNLGWKEKIILTEGIKEVYRNY